MKKLFEKKTKLFGKEISVFLIALIGVAALASAALVPYLSGMVIANFGVDHPIMLEASKDNSSFTEDATLDLGGIYGGDSFNYFVKVTYNGNETIELNLTSNITNSNGNAECGDFESLMVYTPTDIDTLGGSISAGDINLLNVTELGGISLCQDTDNGAVIKIPAKYGWEGDSPQTYEVKGTFKLNVMPADYSISTQATL